MSVKRTALAQYQSIAGSARGLSIPTPAEGWLRTTRKALGMSASQLARRMGLTRARVAQAEKAELDGGITLRSMQAAAEAMGCRFVYAVVPSDTFENVILAQARRKAQAIVGRAGKQMALEDQVVPDDRTRQQIARLTNELAYEMPPGFWEDK